jgi:hypothetical protein
MRRIENDDTDYGIPDWVLEEERKAKLRGIAAEQKLWARKIKLNQRVREQSRCLRMTPLLFHGTWHLDAIYAECCLTGAERVCFSRRPWPAVTIAFGWPRQSADRPAAVLIFDRDRLRARYKIRLFKDTHIWYDDCEKHEIPLWEA